MNLNSIRAHLSKKHKLTAEQSWLLFREHPGNCIQCFGCVKFLTFQTGYERLCASCNKKNSHIRASKTRKQKQIPAWNLGLSEQTNDSVKKGSNNIRAFIKNNGHWRTGQTKENNEAVARSAENISRTLVEKWKNEKHWTQNGGTAENDERIKRRSISIGEGVKLNHWSRNSSADEIKRNIVVTRKRLISEGINSPFRTSSELVQQRLNELKSTWAVEDFDFKGHLTAVNVECKTCNSKFTMPFSILYKGKLCSKCFPANFSKWHREVYEFFISLDPNASINDRSLISPLELDIVSSDKKFAIECNGIYWHSDACNISPSYHQDKSNRAIAQNISLFHIFDDEWNNDVKREIIKSMIRVKLNKASRVMARKLRLHEGHSSFVSDFMSNNHLDGSTPASKAFWLTNDENKIVCALTLRKPHQLSKWGSTTIELARVATLRNHVVVGGMSKLINAAIQWAKVNNYDKMMTYRDLRLGGSGQAYVSSNFQFSHLTHPRFWWTDGSHRIDRFAVRAIPSIASQEEMAIEHRLFRIFGCSNAVYVKNI